MSVYQLEDGAIAANVHMWLQDPLELNQEWVDYLISEHQVNVIVGDFNIRLDKIQLPKTKSQSQNQGQNQSQRQDQS